MRTVTIYGRACVTVAEWIPRPCPVCRTVVRVGERHVCALSRPQPRRQRHGATK
jgi:hypothetical protein